MKKLSRFFFYYTTVVLTAMVIGSVFFFPRPYNLIQPLVLAPAFLFFWLKITDPAGATESAWSMRLVIVATVMSGIGLFGYYLASSATQEIRSLTAQLETAQTSPDQSASISAELAELRQELLGMKTSSQDSDTQATQTGSNSAEIIDLLNSLDRKTIPTPTALPTPQGSIKLKGSQPVNVYQNSNISSKILGVAEPNVEYDFYESFGEWYSISLGANRTGWIEAKLVVEVN